MNPLRGALRLVRQHWRSYLAINGLYFGLVAVAMAVVVLNPQIKGELRDSIGGASNESPFAPVAMAYREGHLASAIALTLLINFFAGSLLVIALPSLVLPFSGLAMGCLRAFVWGLIFSPVGAEVSGGAAVRGALIAGLILLEGHGYTLAMFGAYLQGKSFLLPATAGATTMAQGYWAGIKQSASIYVLVALQLIVAAVYEATIVILILPRLA